LRGWTQILAGYREPSSARSIIEIVITVLPLMFLWLLMWDHPQLAAVGRLTLLESLRCVRMALWDEGRRRGISFREMHATALAQIAFHS